MTALISVNNILNDIENLSTKKIADYVSEELTNKLFEEVKNSIGLKEEWIMYITNTTDNVRGLIEELEQKKNLNKLRFLIY